MKLLKFNRKKSFKFIVKFIKEISRIKVRVKDGIAFIFFFVFDLKGF